ncbi:Glycosyltransferase, catalytic subunit of cellulose synthase and poly-beta-1,6-N-acetylglucosamine synthase [Fodinibius salinus]|uniref:Glycosyltransferase, catalytic subunit of cellulose synthase and poly-beta-1,6-N-acetylglucosamine synthase n=1 Tax=Fodinibius salinus TaxID=860790 RepID=A0A5D3YHJ5_9BACT|nr:cellulose synthase family protein [Fodinibius salinus]TYP92009.1 Glycosyltransferase, catalytic subunit of cellulose synthase and poly-beta-1,6-N-acetylglucosamine synthase [Fodinibius salinus]
MEFVDVIVVGLYMLGLAAIFIYTLGQSHLAYHYLKGRGESREPKVDWSKRSPDECPMVTVQLPIFNEKYVVNRLIDAVADFDWPKERFEIQVLDDSTDETVDIIAEKVQQLQSENINIKHIRRDSREGYKAGALQHGLERAKGEFTAIFDADFVPDPDFLKQTIPHFEDEEVGLVQTRWDHLNRDYSLLTRMQAFALNAHFTVEQKGRNSAGFFMNFNGTAGVWRNSCIKDAGGWHHDTLTEDLDLSYRAQLKDWDFKYLEKVTSPSELPVTVSALKSQQYRWMKGAAETARKHFTNIWNSRLPFITKLQASSHLMSSSIFVCILLISVISVPLLLISASTGGISTVLKTLSFFLSGILLWIFIYSLPLLTEEGKTSRKIGRFILMFPVFLSISMALSAHNSIAVFKGFLGKSSAFIRTPKFNITGLSDSWKSNEYLSNDISFSTVAEGLLALYFLLGVVAAFLIGDKAMLVFHLMLSAGFGILVGYSFYERWAKAV